jgi:hypothetical protein
VVICRASDSNLSRGMLSTMWVLTTCVLPQSSEYEDYSGGVYIFLEEHLRSFCQWPLNGSTGSVGARPAKLSRSENPRDIEFSFIRWSEMPRADQGPGSKGSLHRDTLDWFCDNVMIADAADQDDALCLSSEALADLPRLRITLEGILEDQMWLLPIHRAPEVRHVLRHAGTGLHADISCAGTRHKISEPRWK